MSDMQNTVCPKCMLAYLHTGEDGCPRCERDHEKETSKRLFDEVGRLQDLLKSHERAGLRLEKERDELRVDLSRILDAWLEIDGLRRGPVRKYLADPRHPNLLTEADAATKGGRR
jgi:uncharacterized Zn finger protein (UPF0148 family)